MKLNKEVMSILSNFAGINSNIFIDPGNTIHTMSTDKSLYTAYTFDGTVDDAIGIFDLGRFLKVVSLMGDDPEVRWSSDRTQSSDMSRYLEIESGGRKVRYMQSEKSMLSVPSASLPNLEGDISFRLTEEDRNLLIKAGRVLDCKYIEFFNRGADIYAKTFDPDEDSAVSDVYELPVSEGGYSGDDTFHMVFRFDQIPSYAGDYDIVITDSRKDPISAAQLTHESGKLSYWITMIADHSHFE